MTFRRILPPSFALLVALAFIVAAATIVEQLFGAATARRYIYGSPWFWCLWAAMAGLGLRTTLRRRLWRSPGTFLVHVAFLVVLCGALLTALTSRQGYLHLRRGVPSSHFVDDAGVARSLPFMVRLDSFSVARYPGTEAPRDYVSRVLLDGEQCVISMNHIARRQGYRLYQSSYDPDLQGTVLRVNYDPWGTPVTYGGYLLLCVGMMWSLLPAGLLRRRAVALLLLCAMGLPQLRAEETVPLPVVPQDQLREMEARQVMWNDRVAPMGTLAQEFLLKVYGRRTYHGLTPMQVVVSWASQPKDWAAQPIIKLGSGDGHACLNDFVDYSSMPPRLKGLGEDARTDERVALVLMLMQGTLVKPLPEGVQPLSDGRVRAELLYNRVDWTLWAMAGCFVLVVVGALRIYTPLRRRARLSDALYALCGAGSGFVCLLLAVAFGLRWYVSDRVPLTDSYETMLFVALCVICLQSSVPRLRREPGALLPAAFVLLVAHLSEADPHITPLVPVLHSPWLSAHVSVIMLSYAMLVLSIVDRRLLKPAVFLLAAGIFLGAVWANVSWGSYWSWDPKESWALVTMLVYSLPLHTRSLPWLRSQKAYRIYSIAALLCLAMTYWGVNYLLGGMHSYN